jgi:hypothetical protein
VSKVVWCGVAAVIGVLAAGEVRAHNAGESYLYLQVHRDRVTGRFELPLEDFNRALRLAGTDAEITADTLAARVGVLEDYYRRHVTIADRRGPLEIRFTGHRFLAARGGYALLSFDLPGLEGVPDRLSFDYAVLFDEDPAHRGFLLVEHNFATGTFANENRVSLVFGPGSRRQEFSLTASGRLRGFLALVRLGADHIWLGLDHMLFLVALLLPVALRRTGKGWRPVDGLRPALSSLATIVTAFVAAHALALTLAALGLLRLPEALVETAIAASTTLAAASLLWPLVRGRGWWFVFALSLFHGIGLAGGLMDLGALEDHFSLSVGAFNLGVELGQLAIVAVLFPLLFLVRRLAVYRTVVLPLAAVGLMLVSGVWVVERALGTDVPMRELLPAPIQRVLP